MYFKKPIIESGIQDIKYLAPIPVYQHHFTDDDFSDRVYAFGFETLNEKQKLMGQELPGQFDTERQDNFQVWYDRAEEWVEENEFQPIGSRFSVPPNDFLNIEKFKYSIEQKHVWSNLQKEYFDKKNFTRCQLAF